MKDREKDRVTAEKEVRAEIEGRANPEVTTEPGSTTRSYDSSRRQADARQTRRSILQAAIRLFTSQGYGATSLQSIADQANVSVQTIYATLRNKRSVLAEALDLAISGDDEPVAVNDRDWMQLVWTADSAAERLDAYSRAVARIMASAGDMFMVVTAAALTDADLADLDRETQRRRRVGAERVVAAVAEVGRLAEGLTTETAVDVLWLLNSPSTHHHLVNRAGWSAEQYRAWLSGALIRELLADREG